MNSPARIEIIRWLYDTLKPKRFIHTLGVEETAVRLARAYDISETEASTAALLHDCAKNLSEEELLQICEREHVDLDPNSAYPQLLHAFAAPYTAQQRFGNVFSPEILDAIRYHTTGRAEMTLLDKIIFSADYTEPGRKPFPGLEEARTLLPKDLDQGTLYILKNTVEYLHRQDLTVHPYTMEALQNLSNQ